MGGWGCVGGGSVWAVARAPNAPPAPSPPTPTPTRGVRQPWPVRQAVSRARRRRPQTPFAGGSVGAVGAGVGDGGGGGGSGRRASQVIVGISRGPGPPRQKIPRRWFCGRRGGVGCGVSVPVLCTAGCEGGGGGGGAAAVRRPPVRHSRMPGAS